MQVLRFKCQDENHNYKELEIFLFIQDGFPNKSTVVDNIDSMLESAINTPTCAFIEEPIIIKPKRGRPVGSFKKINKQEIIIKNKVGRPKGSIKEKNVNIHTININTV